MAAHVLFSPVSERLDQGLPPRAHASRGDVTVASVSRRLAGKTGLDLLKEITIASFKESGSGLRPIHSLCSSGCTRVIHIIQPIVAPLDLALRSPFKRRLQRVLRYTHRLLVFDSQFKPRR